MSSIRKRGEKWQARVHRKDHKPVVQSFNTKADAIKWARNVESQLDLGVLASKQSMPRMMSVLARYLEEVTPTKKGVKQERNRIRQLQKSKLADMTIDKITSEAIAQYRDTRLKTVSANTVRIELALISVVFEQSRKEWGFALTNPVRGIRIPKPGKPRQRRLEGGEEEALLAACRTSRAYYLHSFVVLAIETGKTKCRFHGGASTGPKTDQGRQRCAEAKTIHGNETRRARIERAESMRWLRALEDLGYALGLMSGHKTPGRKPSR